MSRLAWALCLLVFVIGCSSEPAATEGQGEKMPLGTAASTSNKANPSPDGAAPAIDKKQIEALKVEQEKAKQTYESMGKKAGPDVEKAKTDYIAATLNVARAHMDPANGLAPREKYRPALAYYREVLKVDPANSEAKEAAQTIIDIYKSMGMPVPGE